MLTFLKSLFRAREAAPDHQPEHEAVEHNGFVIRPAPFPAKGGFQTAGLIVTAVNGVEQEHRFIRAETHPTREEAAAFAVAKARRIIDEGGDRLFARGERPDA